MYVIPAIDLQDGRCVRLRKGRFEERSDYPDDPVELTARYAGAGARWIHVVDLDGARDGTSMQSDLISRMADVDGVRLQVGGGLRDEASLRRALDAGAARVVIGSSAVHDPEWTRRQLQQLGSERVVLAVDVKIDEPGDPRIQTHGWTRDGQAGLWDILARYTRAGLHHVLCTDIGRDGMLSGPNVELYGQMTRRFPDIAVQASGGVSEHADLLALSDTGVAAAITGKALLDGKLSLEEVGTFLLNA